MKPSECWQGADGVHKVIEILRDELSTCMALSGIFITFLLYFKYAEFVIIMNSIAALNYDSFTVFSPLSWKANTLQYEYFVCCCKHIYLARICLFQDVALYRK